MFWAGVVRIPIYLFVTYTFDPSRKIANPVIGGRRRRGETPIFIKNLVGRRDIYREVAGLNDAEKHPDTSGHPPLLGVSCKPDTYHIATICR